MTPIQACKETRDLWTKMAKYAEEEKRVVEKSEVPGPWKKYMYRHYCPCCQYVMWSGHCNLCPMQPEWNFYSNLSNTPCEGEKSPYNKWRNTPRKPQVLCIDTEFFCLLIAEMAEEAIERLEKD